LRAFVDLIVGAFSADDRGRTRPNKIFKCSTQELTQCRFPVTIIFT